MANFNHLRSFVLKMDMNSVSHNIKFSFGDVEFCKYSTSETFKDIRENVIEELQRQFDLTELQARSVWTLMEVEHNG